MPIAWPAVADGVAQETAPNRAVSVRPAVTVATWLLMLVAVIVWNSGIGFFAYIFKVGHQCAFCEGVGGINFGDFAGAGRIEDRGLRRRRWVSARLVASQGRAARAVECGAQRSATTAEGGQRPGGRRRRHRFRQPWWHRPAGAGAATSLPVGSLLRAASPSRSKVCASPGQLRG